MTTKLVLRRNPTSQISAAKERMASIQFNCPSCQMVLKVPERRGGTSVRCPGCKQTLEVPDSSQPLLAVPPAPIPPAIQPATPAAPVGTPPPAIQLDSGGPQPAAEIIKPATVAADVTNGAAQVTAPQEEDERIERLSRHHRVSLHRSVIYTQGILLIAVAILAFLVGLAMGGGDSDNEDSGDATVAELEGQVLYQEGRFGKPDPGAAVILLPRGKQPSEQFPIQSLAPGTAAPGDDDPVIQEIRRLGGDYVRTGQNGQFRVDLVSGVEYYLLTISHDRESGSEVNAHDLLEVEKYFADGRQLIGKQSYRWSVQTVQQSKRIEIMFD
jgi:LSD1 subclass zinc finger protein